MTLDAKDWFIEKNDFNSSLRDGRPFGISGDKENLTDMAERLKNQSDSKLPWDENCEAQFLNGGYDYCLELTNTLKLLIQDAKLRDDGSLAYRGHVYIADWRLNPGRILYDNPKSIEGKSISDYIYELMEVGIRVRILLWYPDTSIGAFGSHQCDHLFLLHQVASWNKSLLENRGIDFNNRLPNQDLGVVYLDDRVSNIKTVTLLSSSGSNHQKFIVIRSPNQSHDLNVAYCGGIDLAFTRFDFPQFNGDPQSGVSLESESFSKRIHNRSPNIKSCKGQEYETDLPATYGDNCQIWFDQALKLKGSIVETLEHIFHQRWEDWGIPIIPEFANENLSSVSLYPRSVLVGSEKSIVPFSDYETFPNPPVSDSYDPNEGYLYPWQNSYCKNPFISLIDAVFPISHIDVTSSNHKIQAWQTIPIRSGRFVENKYFRGEFSYMSGLKKPLKNSQELILIFDQYFWNIYYARSLGKAIKENSNLHLIIILPPISDVSVSLFSNRQHKFRKNAIEEMLNGMIDVQKNRIGIFALWHVLDRTTPGLPCNASLNKGIYVHAKSQCFDDKLYVTGSTNINDRSFTNDSELSCAVLNQEFVRNYYVKIWDYLFNEALPVIDINGNSVINFDKPGWGGKFFTEFTSRIPLCDKYNITWNMKYFTELRLKANHHSNIIYDPWNEDTSMVKLPILTGDIDANIRTNDFSGEDMKDTIDPLNLPSKIGEVYGKSSAKYQVDLEDVVFRIEKYGEKNYRIKKWNKFIKRGRM